jgi:mannosyltransferase OCH1-like enzyme
MNLIIIVIILFIFYVLNFVKENFYDFVNVPSEFGLPIDNIEVSPIVGIPKIIHHICPVDFKKWNSKWLICYESWLRLFPKGEYEHMHWDDEDLEQFIAKNYPWFLDVFVNYDVNIKRYDIARVFLLYHYGGIYADMDYIVYKNFFDELPQDKVSIPESPYKWNEHIQNSFMISPPKHNFWLVVIDECYNRTQWNVFSATGPQLLTPMYFKFPNLVNVLPYDLYNPNVYDDSTYDQDKIYAKHLLTTVWQK